MLKTLIFVLIQMMANTVQAITGFAGGPLAMSPSIAVVGLQNAKAAVTLILFISCTIVTVQTFKNFNLKKYLIMVAFMAVGVAAGTQLFAILPSKVLMFIYGLVVIAIGLKRLLAARTGELSGPMKVGALLLAGLMQGMFTSGGPFLVLYAADALPDKDEFRATVSAIWSTVNIYLIADMALRGYYTGYNLGLAAVSLLPVFLVIYIGNRVAAKIPKEAFLKLVYALLTVSGIVLLINAIS